MLPRILAIPLWLLLIILATGCDRKPSGRNTSEGPVEVDSLELERAKAIMSHRTLGLAYMEDNDLEAAEKEFKKLIDLAPEEALGYANLGIVYMRMGKYEAAEEQLLKAVEINPDDPDIRLNLAKVYDLTDKEEESRKELEKTIEINPDHVQSLYSLAETYQNQSDAFSINQWEKYLKKIVETTPSNIVARLYLAEVMIRNEEPDAALGNLEEIERTSATFSQDAMDYFRMAKRQLQSDSLVEALTSVRIFHNMVKLTNGYQTDIQELKGSTTSRVGVPVISFSEARPAFLMEGESLLEVMRYTDVTSSAGLDNLSGFKPFASGEHMLYPHLSVADMDRDGDQDMFVGGYDTETGDFHYYLLENELGRFSDITSEAGLNHDGPESGSIFVDYNNDGFLDLYIAREEKDLLYENVSEGVFRDVSRKAGLVSEHAGNKALFFDLDQEGDLDLIQANRNSIEVYRNNSDGTFTNITAEISFGDRGRGCQDFIFADLDDDGDVDISFIDQEGVFQMYVNLRETRFQNVTTESGVNYPGEAVDLTSGDYNNDGFEDLLITGKNNKPFTFLNNGDGTFTKDQRNEMTFSLAEGTTGLQSVFVDIDNDGFLDILYAGKADAYDKQAVFLFHNTGKGKFEDASFLLPDDLKSCSSAVTFDYNEDGDMDILLADPEKGIRLLRNDGGNANHHLKVQLVGIRTGSGKNNHFGIGARVEVRSGELYQSKTVTDPTVHFGLGPRDKVDVVRILWTNGVPQNIFSPGSDQDLIEEQELKGSCPFLYTWNGDKFEFQKDMIWRSALGMPMGIMGGTTTYAFADASEEYLKLSGDELAKKDGKYEIRVTSELWETIYFDKIELYSIDHPDSVQIFVDEKFTGPPFPEFRAYQVWNKKIPKAVTDSDGNDLRNKILYKDFDYISNFQRDKYQGITEMHDLVLEFDTMEQDKNLLLFLNGWIFPTDASINVALSQNNSLEVHPPSLQVLTSSGEWETLVENIGFPAGKDKTIVVDLSEMIPTAYRPFLRIRTNMEIYWDHIFYSTDAPASNYPVHSLSLESADLHYRGYSAVFRKGGRNGPFWFDYEKVATQSRWRDLQGAYTRYGKVSELLADKDSKNVVMNSGDEVSIVFSDLDMPGLQEGWQRDFILFSVGWVKDGDLNTASGDRVDPYPVHGMTSYPDNSGTKIAVSKELKEYIREYNTRILNTADFRNELRANED